MTNFMFHSQDATLNMASKYKSLMLKGMLKKCVKNVEFKGVLQIHLFLFLKIL